MTENTQPVVDNTPAAAEPAATVDNARNDGDELDRLLADFDQTTTKPAPVPPPVPTPSQPDVAALAAKVQTLEGIVSRVNNYEYKQAMNETIKNVRGDLDPDILDDQFVEAWLDARARQKPELQQAWLQREVKPAAWKKVEAELAKGLAQKFAKLPDKAATEDRAAVVAAVRGASTRAPAEPPANYGAKSNAEFRKEVREQFGFDPGV